MCGVIIPTLPNQHIHLIPWIKEGCPSRDNFTKCAHDPLDETQKNRAKFDPHIPSHLLDIFFLKPLAT